MGRVKYFRPGEVRTFDELKRNVSKEEIQDIIYSMKFLIKRADDGILTFTYIDPPEEKVAFLKAYRAKAGLTDNDMIVLELKKSRDPKTESYRSTKIVDIPEFAEYIIK